VGWSFDQALNYYVVSNVVIGVGFGLCGALIAWHCPRHPVGWLYVGGGVCQTLTACAAPLSQLAHDDHVSTWVVRLLVTVFAFAWPIHIGFVLPLSLLLLPDGRLPSQRWRAVFLAVAVTAPLFVIETGTTPHPIAGLANGYLVLPTTGGWGVLWTISEVRWTLSVLVGLAAMSLRFRRGDEVVRRQLLWILLAAAAVLGAVAPFSLVAGTPIIVLFAVPLLPLGITVAILRHGLLDIRLVVARGLTYALLSGLVLAAYALLVLLLSGVASALLVALVALPLRARLQRAIDRLLYGDRGDPVRVAARVGERLSDLNGGLEAVREAMRLPYVAVTFAGKVIGQAGSPGARLAALPLSPEAELRVGLRSGERSLAPVDARVLNLLSGPLAVAVTATLASRDLQLSREHLVTAREEERRRLRRDLHDGLGPLLTGVALAADAAANVSPTAPEAARDLLRGVRADTRTAIAEVRRLVDDLRPSALDELGLVGALEIRAAQAVRRADGTALHATVESGVLGALPAAVEVAAYRIASEALTNVVRHSSADRVTIRLTPSGSTLCVEVLDDGSADSPWTAGVGTTSMRERAEELGGTCLVGPCEFGGAVRAHLPWVTT
jgi:signal transduction histidine kinase